MSFNFLILTIILIIGLAGPLNLILVKAVQQQSESNGNGVRVDDIVFPPEFFSPNQQSPELRGGWRGNRFLWPGGLVVYYIDQTFNNGEKQRIIRALNEFSRRTCIRFKEYTNARDYVHVRRNYDGCWSGFGRQGGGQTLNLDPNNCLSHGTIIHEFIHAIGFVHEQSRPDRDSYVSINWSNIQQRFKRNFDKYTTSQVNTFGVPYDYSSVMHNDRKAFAINRNRDVIIPKSNQGSAICGACSMSHLDTVKINAMYQGICQR